MQIQVNTDHNVDGNAATVEDAVDGAAEKLARAIEHTIDRLANRGEPQNRPGMRPRDDQPSRRETR